MERSADIRPALPPEGSGGLLIERVVSTVATVTGEFQRN
jgi:hypothetical protein